MRKIIVIFANWNPLFIAGFMTTPYCPLADKTPAEMIVFRSRRLEPRSACGTAPKFPQAQVSAFDVWWPSAEMRHKLT
jgi:hypothetical protein